MKPTYSQLVGKSTIETELEEGFKALFNASKLQAIKMPIDAIVTHVLKDKYPSDYVKHTLTQMGYRTQIAIRGQYPVINADGTGYMESFIARHYHFLLTDLENN